MKSDLKKIIKISLAILIPLLIIYGGLLLYLRPEPKASCEDLDSLLGMKYDSCFFAKNSSLIFSLSKFANNNEFGAVKIQFGDKEVKINNLPLFGKTSYYKFSLDKMPQELTISQYLRKGSTVCSNSKTIAIEACSEDFNPSVSFIPTGDIKTLNTTVIYKPGDVLPSDLIDRARIFNITCFSKWSCNDWEQCINGIQKRVCQDDNNCLISTEMPQIERPCSGCNENWQCSWSECELGNSTPTCRDLNNCGTSFSMPHPVNCREDCTPNIECTSWSQCHANYSVNNLEELKTLQGIKTRVCTDKNNCMTSRIEQSACSVKEAIYSKETFICGIRYVEIYTAADNELVARIKNDQKDGLPSIGLSFDSSQIICDSCSNLIKDSGELGVDCGGKCKPCKKQNYSSDPLSGISEWFRSLIDLLP